MTEEEKAKYGGWLLMDKKIGNVKVEKARDYILRLKFEGFDNGMNKVEEMLSNSRYLLGMDECNWKLKVGTK